MNDTTLHQTLQTLTQCRADLYAESIADNAFDDPHVAELVVQILLHLDAACRLIRAKNKRVQDAAFDQYLAASQ
jgi:hypothetical protein